MSAHLVLDSHLESDGFQMIDREFARQELLEEGDYLRSPRGRHDFAQGGDAEVRDLRPVYLGDDLFARQPICAAALASGDRKSVV